jgi:L-ascorbate metabolism protein UlaG (beta-lactamase superfamily)
MKRVRIVFVVSALLLISNLNMSAQSGFEKDSFAFTGGTLDITFVGHGTLMMEWKGMVIHIDPVMREADYLAMPDADLVLITHEHGDHLDPAALAEIVTPATVVICNEASSERIDNRIVMRNGDIHEVAGLVIEAVPAYNIKNERSPGQPFHPKGSGNGYIISFGDERVYVAGDTENIPEMAEMGNIKIAFLPMNLPYTMSPEMAASAARMVKPEILYPYHFGNSDTSKLTDLLKDSGIEVRIRNM